MAIYSESISGLAFIFLQRMLIVLLPWNRSDWAAEGILIVI